MYSSQQPGEEGAISYPHFTGKEDPRPSMGLAHVVWATPRPASVQEEETRVSGGPSHRPKELQPGWALPQDSLALPLYCSVQSHYGTLSLSAGLSRDPVNRKEYEAEGGAQEAGGRSPVITPEPAGQA